jgi:hypothetical protein
MITGLLDHVDRQLQSARRLLRIVLAQREAILEQDVATVLAQLGEVETEMAARMQLETERDALIGDAGRHLGVAPETLDLDALAGLVPPSEVEELQEKSSELRGLLSEIALVRAQSRMLIRQELTFLEHLIRARSGTPRSGCLRVHLAASPADSEL